MIKTYNLYKTVKKTTKENNLVPVYYDTNILADLSILNDINLEDEHKSAIIKNIQKYHIFHDRQPVFIVLYDDFTTYEVRATFANHRVDSAKTWKRLYTIVQMTNVKITRVDYKDIWKEFKQVTEYIKKTYYQEPINDIEI